MIVEDGNKKKKKIAYINICSISREHTFGKANPVKWRLAEFNFVQVFAKKIWRACKRNSLKIGINSD